MSETFDSINDNFLYSIHSTSYLKCTEILLE